MQIGVRFTPLALWTVLFALCPSFSVAGKGRIGFAGQSNPDRTIEGARRLAPQHGAKS